MGKRVEEVHLPGGHLELGEACHTRALRAAHGAQAKGLSNVGAAWRSSDRFASETLEKGPKGGLVKNIFSAMKDKVH